jgi:hypothetical protein
MPLFRWGWRKAMGCSGKRHRLCRQKYYNAVLDRMQAVGGVIFTTGKNKNFTEKMLQ